MKNIIISFIVISVVAISCCNESHLNNYENRCESEGKDTVVEIVHKRPLVTIDSTDSLVVFYPSFNHIDLVTETMPDKQRDTIIVFCCEAAYTERCLKTFKHENIAGDHVSSGKRFKGYSCNRNTGAFVWYDGRWKFLWMHYSHELDIAAKHGGMGFGQEMMIHEGDIIPTVRPENNGPYVFRALCEVNGKLCVIDSKMPILFGAFKRLCQSYGAREALYLDMGTGWNHSWYRDEKGNAVDLFPKTHDYCTNWIAFYIL